MRQLSIYEIEKINKRLQALKIAYQELYDEVNDHYCSRLENESKKDFEQIFTELNETFGWSVIRDMEKKILAAVESKLRQEQFAFFKTGANKISLLVITAVIAIHVIWIISLGAKDIFILPISISIVFISFVIYQNRKSISFSFDPEKHRPANVLLRIIASRFYLTFGIFHLSVFILNRLDNAIFENQIFIIIFSGISIFTTLYCISLFAVSYEKVMDKAIKS